MEREGWEAFIRERLAPGRPNWPGREAMPGDWRELAADDTAHLLLDYTQNQLARDERPVCETFEVLGLRAKPLSCFPRHLLCEMRLETEEGPGLLAFVYGASGVWPLDLTSGSIHLICEAIGPPAREATAALEYLRLFNAFLRGGSEGRFQILEDEAQLPEAIDGAHSQALHAACAPHVAPPRIHALVRASDEVADVGGEADDSEAPAAEEERAIPPEDIEPGVTPAAWQISAAVLYADGLFAARYRVHCGGKVVMEEDEPLAVDLPLRRERFLGAVRLP